MQLTHAVAVAGTRRTADGYPIAEAKAVRTGIQPYLRDEVGKPDLQVVRVYRPAEEVFSDNSLQSFTHAPVAVNHPDEAINYVLAVHRVLWNIRRHWRTLRKTSPCEEDL